MSAPAHDRQTATGGKPGDGWLSYRRIRAVTEALAEPLSPEDCTAQSMPDASPAKWHLGHTTWFFETLILEAEHHPFRPFDPAYRELFNSYYQTIGPQHPRPRRGLLTRPGLQQILKYRAAIDAHMEQLLAHGRLSRERRSVVELGLQHEQQHQELLLTDIKHLFACHPGHPAYHQAPAPFPAQASPLTWHTYEAGTRQLGHTGTGFAYDNESPRHEVHLPAFQLADRLTTCTEYLAFMEDDGYRRPELWLADGWTRLQESGWQAPLYWEGTGQGWQVMTLAGLNPLRPHEPVAHLSYYEADAFARWCGARLPTEAEWEVAAADVPVTGNFVESGRLHPAPVAVSLPRSAARHRVEPGRSHSTASPTAHTTSQTPAGRGVGAGPPALVSVTDVPPEVPAQMFGDLWEWTGSPYTAYPGFVPATGPLGEYNGKFMCNQMVLRGGSCVSPRSHLRASYRNFLYPHMRWQFSGLRLARDARAR